MINLFKKKYTVVYTHKLMREEIIIKLKKTKNITIELELIEYAREQIAKKHNINAKDVIIDSIMQH